MKSLVSLVIIGTVVSATALTALHNAASAQVLAQLPEEIVAQGEREISEGTGRVEVEFDRALNEFHKSIELAQAAAIQAPQPPNARFDMKLHRLLGRSAPKALVIRSRDQDPATQTTLEEDLSIMSRVLEKTLEGKLGDEDGPKMAGINVIFTGEGAPRSLFIDDYGALFLLNVRLPLLAPTEKVEKPTKEETTDSAWDDARNDLFGRREEGAWLKFDRHEPQEYDGQKVEKLKQGLIEALKSASNIRHLKADDSITICVFGGASRSGIKVVERREGAVRKRTESAEIVLETQNPDAAAEGRRSVMTLRARKADVDAFAKGRLDQSDFAKKVTVTTYAAQAGGWGGAGVFGWAP